MIVLPNAHCVRGEGVIALRSGSAASGARSISSSRGFFDVRMLFDPGSQDSQVCRIDAARRRPPPCSLLKGSRMH